MKKLLSALFFVFLVCTALTLTVSAETYSGMCGENVTWTYDTDTNVLEISGTGAMYDLEGHYEYVEYVLANGEVVQVEVWEDPVAPWDEYKSYITSIVINEGVTHIGKSSFCDHECVKTIEIPASLTSIGERAFLFMDSLTAISVDVDNVAFSSDDNGVLYNMDKTVLIRCPVITKFTVFEVPSSVITIKENAINNCDGIVNIIIPDSVTDIEDEAIDNCSSLESISVNDNNKFYSSEAGVLFNKKKSVLMLYPENKGDTEYTVPSEVVEIGDAAFPLCYNLRSVVLQEGLKKIGNAAFFGCGNLESVVIPNTVVEIGVQAFYSCALTEVKIPKSVTTIGDFAFWCSSLKEIMIPRTVTSISGMAFYPETTIYGYTDSYACEYVCATNEVYEGYYEESVYYFVPLDGKCGENVTWILHEDGELVISGLGEMNNFDEDSPFWSESLNTFIDSVTIEDGVTNIGGFVFRSLDITDVTIPSSVTSIGNYAFYNCDGLTDVIIPDSVTSIGDYAFYECNNITLYGNADGAIAGYVEEDHDVNFIPLKGSCGDSITWTFNVDTKVLIFDGTGEIKSRFYNDDGTIVTSRWWEWCPARELIISEGIEVIGESTFGWMDTLESVKMQSSVITIGGYAFEGCSNLLDISISNNIICVGYDAFYNTAFYNNSDNWQNGLLYINDYLIRVDENISGECVIPEKTKIVAAGAFERCSNLTKVIIPESITVISEGMFSYCSSLSEVIIPDSVTYIDYGAFYYAGMENITIPESVTYIAPYYETISAQNILGYVGSAAETYAEEFDRCFYPIGGKCGDNAEWEMDLSTYELIISGSGDMYDYPIVSGVFTTPWTWNMAKNIIIQEGVTGIGEGTFYELGTYESRANIYIPKSLKKMGSDAFLNSNIENVYITDISSWCDMDFEDGASNPLSAALNVYFEGRPMTSVVIPESVTCVKSFAFYGCVTLEELVISEGVTSIEDHVFDCCLNLKNVAISSTVENIGESAFGIYCDIEKVDIASVEKWCGISFFDETSNPLIYGADLYINGENVTELIIPQTVIRISDYAFPDCNSINTVTIPPDVEYIGKYNFYGNEYLVIYVHDNSCAHAYAEENSIDFIVTVACGNNGENIYWYLDFETGALTLSGTGEMFLESPWKGEYEQYADDIITVTIENGITSICDGAFSECENLSSIIIPASTEAIGNFAFCNCISLADLTIPNSVTTIGEDAFRNCYSLMDIAISDSLTSIGGWAFKGCESLTSITIPDSIVSIGYNAFEGCYSLTDVCISDITDWCNIEFESSEANPIFNGAHLSLNGQYITKLVIPKEVESINDYAFYNCESFTEIDISDGVTDIGTKAFYNCKNLVTISVPNSVSSIGFSAFGGCNKLQQITLPFVGRDSGNTESYHFGYIFGDYYNTDNGNSVPQSIKAVIITGGEAISDCAFQNCDNLISVTIPNCVKSIGEDAFCQCKSLTNITIPDSVTTIGNAAFLFCYSLTSITIPDSVISIGDYAFVECNNDLTIYGYTGSYAETYATDNDIPFKVLDNTKISGKSLYLDGGIGVRVHFEYDSEIISPESLVFNVALTNSKDNSVTENEVPLTLDTDGKSAYAIVYVPAKDINIVSIGGMLVGETLDGSVVKLDSVSEITVPMYIKELEEKADTDSSYANILDVVHAMQTYCSYADAYFNNTEIDDITLTDAEESAISEIASPSITNKTLENIEFYSTSLLLEGTVTLRHYFKVTGDVTLSDYTVEGGSELKLSENSEGYAYIDIENISANELGVQKTVKITNNGETTEIVFSPLNYVKLAYNDDDTALKNLVRALYRYGVKATEYAE